MNELDIIEDAVKAYRLSNQKKEITEEARLTLEENVRKLMAETTIYSFSTPDSYAREVVRSAFLRNLSENEVSYGVDKIASRKQRVLSYSKEKASARRVLDEAMGFITIPLMEDVEEVEDLKFKLRMAIKSENIDDFSEYSEELKKAILYKKTFSSENGIIDDSLKEYADKISATREFIFNKVLPAEVKVAEAKEEVKMVKEQLEAIIEAQKKTMDQKRKKKYEEIKAQITDHLDAAKKHLEEARRLVRELPKNDQGVMNLRIDAVLKKFLSDDDLSPANENDSPANEATDSLSA
jgi:hypothetical protein